MGLKENLQQLEALRGMLGAANDRSAFGREVRLARKKRGLTLEALAGATGMAKSYLSQIETGYASPPRDDKVRKIARALGLEEKVLVAVAHLSQLPDDAKEQMAGLRAVLDSTEEAIRALLAARGREAEGEAEPPAEQAAGVDLESLHATGLLHHLAEWGADRLEAKAKAWRPIPIINKVAAGYPQEFTDLGYPVGFADEYVTAPAEMSDPHAFAVRVVGDSMEPRYGEGDIVIFSPAAPVASGDDCFVRFAMVGGPSDGETTFKRVFFDSEDCIRLQPLNERHAPTLVKPSRIAGIFRAVARYEKL